jgi:DNA-directed DNA polymerase III PolC
MDHGLRILTINDLYLNCHTWLSFKYGTLSIKAFFKEAARCGVKKVVITEINNTASYIEMMRYCKEENSYPLEIALGIEFRKENELQYIAIAKNNKGFEEINRFLSYHNSQGTVVPARAPAFENVFVVYPFLKIFPEQLREEEFIGVRISQVSQFGLQQYHKSYANKFVIHHPVTFADKIGFNIHRLLRAIDNNLLLSKLPEQYQAQKDEIMMPEDQLIKNFINYPALIQNTKMIMDSCTIDFRLGVDKNKKSIKGSKENDWTYLVEEAKKGLEERYDANGAIMERFERELQIIKQKNFCSYYLITHDIIKFAKRSNFDFVGRGSGANSLVAYCLGITNVDPIELDLYFERFLNPERSSPPDFDVDFSWTDRDAIYDYIFSQYGADHVCLLGTHVTFHRRSVVRELGKVFGLPKEEIDDMVEEPDRHKNRDQITELIFKYAELLHEFPSHISIHAGGVLITEEPICAYTAINVPPKGYAVSHFEMHSAEDFGIYKLDILSQRGLGHLKDAIQLVKKNRNIDVDINRFADFKNDPLIKEHLRSSKAMGCFYVESPAMRMLLGKLGCEDYLTLVAASSIIRPGVASSGMMKAYIERYHAVHNGGTYQSIHPMMDELMAETFGVMVYQEDVIKVAHHFAKLSLSEADVLRRAMSGKFRARTAFERVYNRFFDNCRAQKYEENVIQRVWHEIESFAGYSFSKGHSASYAVESYQSLYLKAHYPLEFMVGVINNFGGFYQTEFYFHEARMNGGNINAPCVNKSEYLTTIYGKDIYIGFVHLKSLEAKLAKQIAIERENNGTYNSLTQFIRRINVGLEQLRVLIRIGAFRFTGKSKQHLLWEAMLYFNEAKSKRLSGNELFDTDLKNYPLPKLERNSIEDAFDEIELVGFPLCDPFTLVEADDLGDTAADELLGKLKRQITIMGYLVTRKDTSTKKGQLMCFGTFYDKNGKVFDTVHFPDIARKWPFRGRGFYFIKGKVVEDFRIAMIEVSAMVRVPFKNKKVLSNVTQRITQ